MGSPAFLDFMVHHSKWTHHRVKHQLMEIAMAVNDAISVKRLRARYKLDPNFDFEFTDHLHPLIPDVKSDVQGRRVHLRVADVKEESSALRKVLGMDDWISEATAGSPKQPLARYIT